jgi:hypothetical protein
VNLSAGVGFNVMGANLSIYEPFWQHA